MAKKSKAYREAIAKVPSEAVAPLEAMKVVKEVATKKFDETVEVHFRLGIDTRQADQQLRGTVSLPNGSGKTVRVAVFAEGAMAEAAKEAGADIVGTEELTQQIQAGLSSTSTPLWLLRTRWARLAVSVRSSAPAVSCRTPSSAR